MLRLNCPFPSHFHSKLPKTLAPHSLKKIHPLIRSILIIGSVSILIILSSTIPSYHCQLPPLGNIGEGQGAEGFGDGIGIVQGQRGLLGGNGIGNGVNNGLLGGLGGNGIPPIGNPQYQYGNANQNLIPLNNNNLFGNANGNVNGYQNDGQVQGQGIGIGSIGQAVGMGQAAGAVSPYVQQANQLGSQLSETTGQLTNILSGMGRTILGGNANANGNNIAATSQNHNYGNGNEGIGERYPNRQYYNNDNGINNNNQNAQNQENINAMAERQFIQNEGEGEGNQLENNENHPNLHYDSSSHQYYNQYQNQNPNQYHPQYINTESTLSTLTQQAQPENQNINENQNENGEGQLAYQNPNGLSYPNNNNNNLNSASASSSPSSSTDSQSISTLSDRIQNLGRNFQTAMGQTLGTMPNNILPNFMNNNNNNNPTGNVNTNTPTPTSSSTSTSTSASHVIDTEETEMSTQSVEMIPSSPYIPYGVAHSVAVGPHLRDSNTHHSALFTVESLSIDDANNISPSVSVSSPLISSHHSSAPINRPIGSARNGISQNYMRNVNQINRIPIR